MVNFTAVFALSAALSLANAEEYKVRVRNLTYLQPFSPPLIVAHTRHVALFKEGFAASDAIKLMAENGDASALVALTTDEDVAPYICGAVLATGPLGPGDTMRGTMEVDTDICDGGALFSVVSMLVNTNDAFVGIDSETLVTSGASKTFPPAFDAGTETNNELCSSIPGPACDADSGNEMSGSGEGFIHVHHGVQGNGDFSGGRYDWRNPVAEVVIFAP